MKKSDRVKIKIVPERRAGFTLVELLVSMAVFGLIIAAVVGVIVSGLRAQLRIIALQRVQDSGRYIIEIATKEIRSSSVNSLPGGPLSLINITNPEGKTFFYEIKDKKFWRNGMAITPDNIEIVDGGFYVRKTQFPETTLLTLFLKMRALGGSFLGEASPEINLQMTVASRNF